MIKILLADDHKIVRKGIRKLLEGEAEFKVVGEASNGIEALELIARLEPDILLCDIAMPELNGLELAEKLKTQNHPIKIIILSMHDEPEYVIRSIQCGAKGYLVKTTEPIEMLTAIRQVNQGEQYFAPSLTVKALSAFAGIEENKEENPHHIDTKLTERELEILKLVVKGESTKIIAAHLFISPRTVETHRNHIMKKLKAANTAELVRLALLYGLV